MRLTPALPAVLVALSVGCGGETPNTPSDASPEASLDASLDASFDAARDAAPVDAVYTGDARVEVTRYDYALDLTTRAVVARLSLRVLGAGDCVALPFRPAAATEVSFGGAPAREVTVADGRLRACDGASRGWPVGAVVELSAHTALEMNSLRPTQVGYSTRRNAAGALFTYLLSWVGECDRHGPCDTTPSVFATYRFTVDHPSGTRVFCPGTITAEATRTVCAFDHPGGPTYSTFGLIAGSGWTEVPLGAHSGVNVTLYDTPMSGITAALDRGALDGFLGFMTRTFGPYPYGDSLRLVVAPTYWAGFEHPGNIVLADSLGRGRLGHTLLHEIAHQWAGDQTTVSTTHDFVWKEAMAEYLSFVYEDENRMPDEARATAALWKDTAARAMTFPVPTDDRTLVEYYSAAYGAGTMILFRQIEVMFGRPRVIAALRTLLGAPRAISVEDVRMALEASTGAQLSGYFGAWLRGRGVPTWPVATVTRTAAADGAVTVAVRVVSADGMARGQRFSVRLTGAAGQTFDVPIDLGVTGTVPAPVTVRPGFEVTGDVLDPASEALVYAPRGGGGTSAGVREPWLAPL